MLHSHPQWKKSRKDNDLFSPGDAVVSVLSGKIYLTTPHGNLYALEKEDGKGLILPGIIREQMVKEENRADAIGIPPQLLLSLWGLLYSKNYINRHDAKSKGTNFEQFDVKTYDTRY